MSGFFGNMLLLSSYAFGLASWLFQPFLSDSNYKFRFCFHFPQNFLITHMIIPQQSQHLSGEPHVVSSSVRKSSIIYFRMGEQILSYNTDLLCLLHKAALMEEAALLPNPHLGCNQDGDLVRISLVEFINIKSFSASIFFVDFMTRFV